MLASKAIGHAAMLMFSALVAFSFTFGGLVANDIDPAVLTTIRFVVALCVMGAVASLAKAKKMRIFSELWRWLIIGGCMAAYFNLMFWALRHTTAMATSAVFTLTPLIATGFGYLLIGASVGRVTLAALFIGALGTLWVIFKGDLELALAFSVGKGEAIFLVGAIAHAAVPALTRKLVPWAAPLEAAIGTVVGALIITALIAAPELVVLRWAEVSPTVWLVAVYLGVGATAATFFLLQVAVARLTPGKLMAYTYLIPGWVTVHGLVMGRREQPILYVGIALTLVALFILLFSDAERAHKG